jgi:DUF4097 and DUF4098 domain-containing protein YvlB
MKLKLITAATLLSLTTFALASDTFDRTLKVSGPADLYVSTGSGSIRIHPGTDSEIHIVGHVHAGWSSFGDVTSRVQHIVDSPPIVQTGNAIRVGESNDHSLFNNISIDYEITAPASVALNVHSGSGDVEIDHVGRYLSASSGSGSVRAHGIHGPADLQSGSGDIELQDEGQGDIKARTGSGSIRINGLNGGLNAKTGSGDIEANGRLAGEGNLTSGSGSVRLHLTPDAHFNLGAETGSGSIRIHFPNTEMDNDSRHHLTASVNGGGPALEVRTGSGDIEVTSNH